MTAIILAAGMGRRLSLGIPKCLIEIAGASILARQIAALRAVGVRRFVLVVGYRQEEVRRHLAGDPGPFTFVVNERFAETNTIYSLYLAREHFGEGFYYANGDVVFDHRLARLLSPANASTVMAVKPGRWGQEEVKVFVGPASGSPASEPTGRRMGPQAPGEPLRILRIGKQLDPARALGEFVGVARFGSDLVRPLAQVLTDCIEQEGMVGEHFERAVDRLCVAGHVVRPADIGDLPCGEIDFPEDLIHARNTIAPQLQ